MTISAIGSMLALVPYDPRYVLSGLSWPSLPNDLFVYRVHAGLVPNDPVYLCGRSWLILVYVAIDADNPLPIMNPTLVNLYQGHCY